jgi:hypothetical protein
MDHLFCRGKLTLHRRLRTGKRRVQAKEAEEIWIFIFLPSNRLFSVLYLNSAANSFSGLFGPGRGARAGDF